MHHWSLITHEGNTVVSRDGFSAFFATGHSSGGLDSVVVVELDKSKALLVSGTGPTDGIVFPVRLQMCPGGKVALVEARFHQKEHLFSALPIKDGGNVEPIRLKLGPWEQFRLVCSSQKSWFDAQGLIAMMRLIGSPDDLHEYIVTSGRFSCIDLRLFLSFQSEEFASTFSQLLVARTGRFQMENLADLFENVDFRDGFVSLALWLKDRNNHEGGRVVLTVDQDYLADWPTAHTTFDAEFLRMVRSSVEPKKKSCIVATARNEGAYLLEWIAYHRALGVEKIFIYSNNNDDHSDLLLSALAAHKFINYIPSLVGNCRPQFKAYSHALKLMPQILDFEWALFIDMDEFVVIDTTLFSGFGDYADWVGVRGADSVGLNWLTFGVYGNRNSDLSVPVTKRCILRHRDVDQHIRSFFKPRYFSFAHAHYPWWADRPESVFRDNLGNFYEPCPEFAFNASPSAEYAWINHYWTRSFDELAVRAFRNTGDQPVETQSSFRALAVVNAVIDQEARDPSPIEDRRISFFDLGTRQNQEMMLEFSDIREAYRVTVERKAEAIKAAVAGLASEAMIRDEALEGSERESG